MAQCAYYELVSRRRTGKPSVLFWMESRDGTVVLDCDADGLVLGFEFVSIGALFRGDGVDGLNADVRASYDTAADELVIRRSSSRGEKPQPMERKSRRVAWVEVFVYADGSFAEIKISRASRHVRREVLAAVDGPRAE